MVSVVVIGGVLYGLNSGKTPPPVDPNAHVDPGEGDGGGDGGGAIDDGGAVVVDHGDGKLEWHGHRYTTPKTPEEVEATASRLAEKAIGDAKDFVFDGQYQKAIELLESFPEDLQKGSAFSEVTSELALYKRYQVYKEKLDTTLKGDREALKSMVKRILSQDLPPELQELECNGPFLVEARNILGVEEFGKLEVGEVTEDQ